MKLPAHGRYPYSAIGSRSDYAWPGGRRLAVYVLVSVEHFAFGAGIGEDISTPGAAQTQRNYGWRDYGQRVGLWRLLRMLDTASIPVALAVNSALYRYRPDMMRRLHARGDEILGHGRTSSETLNDMWDHDLGHLIREATEAISSHAGTAPQGWLSPGFGASRATPDLLRAAGYRYVLDWPADDQPFWMRTPAGALLSVPYQLEMEDVTVLLHRRHAARTYADMIVHQFEVMLAQSRNQPLVFGLGLRPYVCGQPFRLHALRKALAHCVGHRESDAVWFTRPGEIARYCETLPPDVLPAP